MKPRHATLALVAVAAGCGPTVVRTYPGAELGPGQACSLWSNEHMSMSVDEKYGVPINEVAFRRRFDMTPGHHVVRLTCMFTDDVQYLQAPSPVGAPIVDQSLGGQPQPILRRAGAPTQSSAAITGSPPPAPTRPTVPMIESFRSSRPRLFALDAAAGHNYLPRARFTRDASGQPACDIRIDDITGERDGERAQTF